MGFLAALAAEILKWLLTIGGKALYDYVNDVVDRHEKKKINEENKKEHKDDIANNASPSDKGKSGRKLINGEK